MTEHRFHEIEQEIVDVLNEAIDGVNKKSFEDFVLLLIHANYDKVIAEYPTSNLSPYVIEDPSDAYIDIARQRFLTNYLNEYVDRMMHNIFIDVNIVEYEMNMQMMMYAHAWESDLLLKLLERIAKILNGEGYQWKSVLDKKISKGNFMKDHVLKPLKNAGFELASLIEYCYDNGLRNDFAHSTYYLDFDSGMICSCNGGFLCGKRITFNDWEEKFAYTVLLSYHLTHSLQKLKDEFIDNYGTYPILLMRPLQADPTQYQKFYVHPEYDYASQNKRVKFNFV